MSPADPQFMYLVLILPGLSGLIFITEGVGKLLGGNAKGFIPMIFGMFFLGVVVLGYLIFSDYLAQNL